MPARHAYTYAQKHTRTHTHDRHPKPSPEHLLEHAQKHMRECHASQCLGWSGQWWLRKINRQGGHRVVVIRNIRKGGVSFSFIMSPSLGSTQSPWLACMQNKSTSPRLYMPLIFLAAAAAVGVTPVTLPIRPLVFRTPASRVEPAAGPRLTLPAPRTLVRTPDAELARWT